MPLGFCHRHLGMVVTALSLIACRPSFSASGTCEGSFAKVGPQGTRRERASLALKTLVGVSIPSPASVAEGLSEARAQPRATAIAGAKFALLAIPQLVRSVLQNGFGIRFHGWMVGNAPVEQGGRASRIGIKSAQTAYDLVAPQPRNFLRLLFPGIVGRKRDAGEKVLVELWAHPEKVDAEKLATLKQYGLLDQYSLEKNFIDEFPFLHRFLRVSKVGSSVGLNLPIWLLFGMSLQNAIVQNAHHDDNPSVEDYLKDPKFRPNEDEVQLVVNTVPFPHLAIRIGDRVYSYGVSHMTRQPADIYFKPGETKALYAKLVEAYEHRDQLSPEDQRVLKSLISEEEYEALKTGRTPKDFSGRNLQSAMALVGSDHMPRTTQVVTLKVGKEEHDRILRELELNKGKRYDNQTFVNDCASMVFRALKMENPLVDPSPSLVVLTMQNKKLLGDERVKGVFTVFGENAPRSRVTLMRDAYVNFRESTLHYQCLPYNLPKRWAMDRNYTAEDFQKWDPAIRKEIESWREEVKETHQKDEMLQMYQDQASNLAGQDPANPKTIAKKALLKRNFDADLTKLRASAEATYQAPESELKDIFRASYQLEVYSESELSLNAKLGFPTISRPLPSPEAWKK